MIGTEDERWAQTELARTRRRLEQSEVGPLREVEPELPARVIAADAALGLQTTSEPVIRFTLYVHRSDDAHDAAVDHLRKAFPDSADDYVLLGSYGAILFFGHTKRSGKDGTSRVYGLSYIASEFAGDE